MAPLSRKAERPNVPSENGGACSSTGTAVKNRLIEPNMQAW